jgi:hypothetical protein
MVVSWDHLRESISQKKRASEGKLDGETETNHKKGALYAPAERDNMRV